MVTVLTAKSWRPIDLVYSGLFATLMMIGANITSFAPFLTIGGVPITFQTFIAILGGLVLGSNKGAIACTVYMLIGLAGAPVFAKFGGGFSEILDPTFGFIVAFIVSAYVAGYIVEKYKTRKSFVIAAVIATFINYIIGINWAYVAYMVWFAAPEGFSYSLVLLWMALPFVKDFILCIFAGFFAYRVQKTLKVLPIK